MLPLSLSRLLQMGDTAMTEGLTSGCTVHVLKRLRRGARMGGTGIGYVPGQWQCLACGADKCWPTRPQCYRCAQPRGTLSPLSRSGPPARVPVLVPGRVPLPPALGGNAPAPGLPLVLGWCLVPLVRPLLLKVQGFPSQAGCLGMGPPLLAVPGPPPGAVSVSAIVTWSSSLLPPPGGKERMAPPTSDPSPSLGPSQAFLLNALALLSGVLGPS